MKRKKIKLNLEDFGLDSFLETPSLDQLNMIGGDGDGPFTQNPIKCLTEVIGTGGVVTCIATMLSIDISGSCTVGVSSDMKCSSGGSWRTTASCCPPPPLPPPSSIAMLCPPPPPSNCPTSPYISCTHS